MALSKKWLLQHQCTEVKLSLCAVLQEKLLNVRLTGYVDASGLELSSTAGVALQQADDGGVALSAFDELLQRQLA